VSGLIGSPSGLQKTSPPWKRLESLANATRSVGARSIVRRERRDFGVTNFPRQSARRTAHPRRHGAQQQGAHRLVRGVEEPPDLGRRLHLLVLAPRPLRVLSRVSL